VNELDEELKFSWNFNKVVNLKTEAKRQLDRVRAQQTKESTPAQVEHPQEVWLHAKHTRGQRDQERQQRAWNLNRQYDAAKRGEEASAYLVQAQHSRKRRRRRGPSNNSESEETTAVSSQRALFKLFLTLKKQDVTKAVVGDGCDLVEEGDYLLFRFDTSSRAEDKKQSGYSLPLHIGKVTEVLSSDSFEVWWMYSKSWQGGWMPWRAGGSGAAYKTTMKTDDILMDTEGVAAKVTFTTRARKPRQLFLTPNSIFIVEELLKLDPYSHSEANE